MSCFVLFWNDTSFHFIALYAEAPDVFNIYPLYCQSCKSQSKFADNVMAVLSHKFYFLCSKTWSEERFANTTKSYIASWLFWLLHKIKRFQYMDLVVEIMDKWVVFTSSKVIQTLIFSRDPMHFKRIKSLTQ